ncbi:MAG: helix-turn-helix transcriptional regulator [Christensenellaceae bacterium]|jgi:DNA-binding Xre family transcriptional regulator|nr:helix-turn-helix transcriptional regulator [Christensenellaceae bacterium]
MQIGEAIRLRVLELCAERNITVNKLSTMAGITQSTLSNIISGRNKSATVSTVKKICDALEITINEFFDAKFFQELEQELR